MIDSLPHDADGDALRRLVATGSDLTKEMLIDFAVDVPDRNAGMAFASAVSRLGVETNIDQYSKTGKWTCCCSRIMVPSYSAIVAFQEALEQIGRPYGARPDGWGSFGNGTT